MPYSHDSHRHIPIVRVNGACLHAEKNSSRDFVVETTLVGVPDQGRNHDPEQNTAYSGPPHTDPAATHGHHTHPDNTVPDTAANGRNEHDLQNDEGGAGRKRVVIEERDREQNSDCPINGNCSNSSSRPGNRTATRFRQPQPLARKSTRGGRNGPGLRRRSRGHVSSLSRDLRRNTPETIAIPLGNSSQLFFSHGRASDRLHPSAFGALFNVQ